MKKEKFTGCLVGAAVGDALGMPLEFLTREQIKKIYGKVKNYKNPIIGTPCSYLKAGQYTDDTQMTIALAKSLIDKKGFDINDISKKFIEWYLNDDQRAPGNGCIRGIQNLIDGKSPLESGTENHAGCGSAMRVFPIGLLYEGENLSEKSYFSSVITHRNPKAIIGTILTAHCIEKALKNEFDKNYLDSLINFCEKYERRIKLEGETMSNKLKIVKDALSMNLEDAMKSIGNGGYVLETVPAAIFSFIRSPDNFEETITTAVNFGGDADSIGTIAGGISGTYNGISNIPEKFVKGLENNKEIAEISKKLYEIRFG